MVGILTHAASSPESRVKIVNSGECTPSRVTLVSRISSLASCSVWLAALVKHCYTVVVRSAEWRVKIVNSGVLQHRPTY